MFSSSQENDGTFSSSDSRKSTSTFGVSIQFGDNTGSNVNTVFEGLGLTVTSLTDTSVHHEDCSVGFHLTLNLLHLVEEGRFLLVTTTGINDNDLVLHLAEVGYTFCSNLNGVSFLLVTEERALYFRCVHFELLKRASTEGISTD